MKIKTILDLRTDYESYDEPDSSIQNIQIYRISGMRELDGVSVVFSSEGVRKRNLKNSEFTQHTEDFYVNMMFNNQPFKFKWMIISDVDSYPLLFHCVSEKDRTCALAALIYWVLGVSKECLILDYLISFNKVGLKTLSQPPLSTAYSEPSDVLNGSLFRCESSSILTQLPSFSS